MLSFVRIRYSLYESDVDTFFFKFHFSSLFEFKFMAFIGLLKKNDVSGL